MIKPKPLSANEIEMICDDDVGEMPMQLANDALGCPRCRVELTSRKSRMFVEGVAIGMFDSLACEFCGFFLLTEKGFDESAQAIRMFGLDETNSDAPTHRHEAGQKQHMKSLSVIASERVRFPQAYAAPNLTPKLTIANPALSATNKPPDLVTVLLFEAQARIWAQIHA